MLPEKLKEALINIQNNCLYVTGSVVAVNRDTSNALAAAENEDIDDFIENINSLTNSCKRLADTLEVFFKSVDKLGGIRFE